MSPPLPIPPFYFWVHLIYLDGINAHGKQYNINGNTVIIFFNARQRQYCNNIDMYMFNQCYCCYSKPILDVADNKFAESAAVLMLNLFRRSL